MGRGGGRGGVKEKRNQMILSAYPLQDQPFGTSVPFMPQARPWNARQANPPPLSHLDKKATGRLGNYVEDDSDSEDEGENPMGPKVNITTRPTASVTEVPGAAAAAIKLHETGDLRNPTRSVRGLFQRRKTEPKEDLHVPTHHFTFPAMMWFLIGLVCPILFLCGFRYIRSANAKAKMFGWASIFMLGVYAVIGLAVGAKYWRIDDWTGEDPACIQYIIGTTTFLNTKMGSAIAVHGITAPGLGPATNISLYKVNCSFVAQVVVDASNSWKTDGSNEIADRPPRTFVVRMATPGTTGDNFGVYVRSRGSRINPSIDSAPAKSWFSFADPYESNPYQKTNKLFGQRPPCLIGMCDGSYGPSLPDLSGAQYEAKVSLGWYKYYMTLAVFAKDKQALERPFCVDTCVLTHTWDVVLGKWVEPCVDQELTTCSAYVNNCNFAVTRNQCLGIFTRRDGQVSIEAMGESPIERITKLAVSTAL